MKSFGRFGGWALVAACTFGCGDPAASNLFSGAPSSGHGDAGASEDDAGTSGALGGGSSGDDAGASLTPTGDAATPPSGGGDGGDASAPGSPGPGAGAGLTCEVAALLAAKCDGCHASPPVNGSLSALVSLTDMLATSKEDATKNEAELSLTRMQNAASPMPPATTGTTVTAAEIQALSQWIQNGYQGSCTDGGVAAPPPGVFASGPAFVSKVDPSTHNSGKNCMNGCHNHGFTFAGTLTDGKGNTIAGAEVRLVDAKGQMITVHTGPTGNFHSSTAFTAPARVGARDATQTASMVTALQATNGGCNGCHATGGTTAPIHLP